MASERQFVRLPDDPVFDDEAYFYEEYSKSLGQFVFDGENCCELELGKAVVPIPSLVSGVITKVLVEDNQTVKRKQEIYEVMPVSNDEDVVAIAQRILSTRFPNSASIFEELLGRVSPEKILASLQVISQGTPQLILQQLSSSDDSQSAQ